MTFPASMNANPDRNSSRIGAWFGSLLDRSSVDKCLAIAAVSLALRFVNAMVIETVSSDPGFMAIVDGDVFARFSQSFWGATLFWTVMVTWGLAIRRRAPEAAIYVTVVLVAVALTSVAVAFLSGHYTTPALLVILGFLAICYMAFPRRFYLPPAITIAVLLVTMSVLERLHLIPYAPLFKAHGYGEGAHPNGTVVLLALLTLLVALLVIGSAFVSMVQLIRYREALLRDQSRTDSLTGVANRRHFVDQADRELARAARFGLSTACLMLDLDRFKQVNDRFGHAAGDHVLISIASRLARLLRQHDVIGRIGGEEFAMLLAHTDLAQAAIVAERCRQVVADIDFIFDGLPLRVTASIGIVSAAGEGLTTDELLSRADKGLYRAKADGRNCVRFAEDEPTTRLPRSDLVSSRCSVIQADFRKLDRERERGRS
jgi:diguanylate cyclase (GGDEF)-like protein